MSTLKTYNILLKTRGPLHIGSGKTIGKKEYILDNKNRVVRILNMENLAKLIFKKNLFDSYQNFMCGPNKDLSKWFKDNNISDDEISSITNYSISFDTLSKNENPYEINTFVKDAYNTPYVPGSSVKGALRTVLLAYFINKNKNILSDVQSNLANPKFEKNNKKHLSSEIKNAESMVFNTLNRETTRPSDAVNDVMQGIIVGDSVPLSKEKLMICQKRDLLIDNSENTLSVFYECIAPDTIIKLPLTIDTSLCPISIDDINMAIQQFYKNYITKYDKSFNSQKKRAYTPINTLLLGGNVGFLSKTINYNVFEKQKALMVTQETLNKMFENRNPKMMKNRNDHKLGLSPHVLHVAKVNNQLLHMGECTISIKEI